MIDESVNPCEDFYQYACGTWLKKTELPADRPVWSRGFIEIEARNEKILKTIVESYSTKKPEPANPYSKKIGDVYSACMNEKNIEKTATKDFRAEAKNILAMKSMKDVPSVLADLHLKGVKVLFKFQPDEDLKDPTEKIMNADQGGLGLPTPEYYSSDNSDFAELRKTYAELAENALIKAGLPKDKAIIQANKVLEIETKLAQSTLPPAERRDPNKLYSRLNRQGLMVLTPKFDWPVYLKDLGISDIDKINVAVPTFFSGLDQFLATAKIEDLKSYFLVRLYVTSASAMDHASVENYYKYVSRIYGLKQVPPRSRRCLDEVSNGMGFALGHAFVDKTFLASAKKEAEQMVKNLQTEMRATIQHIDWMDETTRTAALKKLENQLVIVGYPDKWQDYSELKIVPSSMLKNRLAANTFNLKFHLGHLNKPADRREWVMAPMEVNAANTVSQNVIKFPAGILQAPNFSEASSDESNYGAMGTIVGHEITHGYDDQGRSFDEIGAVRNWWSEKTDKEFQRRAQCIIDQYGEYKVDKDTTVNGRLVAGEAIGDLGGMKLAFAAWKRQRSTNPIATSTTGEGKPAFTPEQNFFLARGQAWCSKTSPAFEKFQTNSDPHPLDRFRVNGTVRNVPEFATAFACKAGATLAPRKRCEVW